MQVSCIPEEELLKVQVEEYSTDFTVVHVCPASLSTPVVVPSTLKLDPLKPFPL